VTALLSAMGLTKKYGGVLAVDRVSFSVTRGEIAALIGPNGAGKTTCFKMLSGQTAPDSGHVFIESRETTGLSPRQVYRLGVGRTFQITETFASMTVTENVQTALLSHRRELSHFWAFAPSRHRLESGQILGFCGISDKADQPAGELAYGDLKRLELAIALAGEPRLLLMDEPTAGMSPAERMALMRLVAELARGRNMGVLFTEHDMDIVFEHASRILVLDRGAIVAEGSPEEVRRNRHVRAIYLGGAAA
jgi:branched-chain amino acid transport system ATP-binding protein